MKKKRLIGKIIYHVLVCGLGLVMIYPLVWMIMSSFKPTSTIFTTAGQLIPTQFVFENYVNGWKGFAKITFATFFKNSLFISIVATMGTLISSSLVAFGLSRCKFFGRRALFVAMLLSMMLPAQVLMIPQYLWYQKLGWVGSYKPLIIPYFFAIQGFFVYLLSNFIGGIPIELDEAAKIDGANSRQLLHFIKIPMIRSSITICVFMAISRAFMSFDVNLTLTAGGPFKSTELLALKIYQTAFSNFDYGKGQAEALVLFVIVAIISLVQVSVSKKGEVQA